MRCLLLGQLISCALRTFDRALFLQHVVSKIYDKFQYTLITMLLYFSNQAIDEEAAKERSTKDDTRKTRLDGNAAYLHRTNQAIKYTEIEY
uniref:Secreted protein n=1 Tax=Steinernema glaseri TaxID=37863 RepID=A0A1I8A8K0_9BILA